jgi:hypothetical protein
MEEKYIKFINKYVKGCKGSWVTWNKIYLFFCSYYDIEISELSYQTFIAKFIATYTKLYQKNLELTKKRIEGRKNPVSVLVDLCLVYTSPDDALETYKVQERNSSINLALMEISNKARSKQPLSAQGTTLEQGVVHIRNTKDLLTLEEYIKLKYQPGVGKYTTKEMYEEFLQFFEGNSKELARIPSIFSFKRKFGEIWNSVYPQSNLDMSVRIGRNDKGLGGLIKKE